MELDEAISKLENMHFDDIAKSYCNKVNRIDVLLKRIESYENREAFNRDDLVALAQYALEESDNYVGLDYHAQRRMAQGVVSDFLNEYRETGL